MVINCHFEAFSDMSNFLFFIAFQTSMTGQNIQFKLIFPKTVMQITGPKPFNKGGCKTKFRSKN